ncbi:MAG: SLBB domain-containing protein [Candidatus Marinimicrobia bacterium]|nr:SLBB domain-containing protein [Candidatus Neomarinimicrobiota bacterium]
MLIAATLFGAAATVAAPQSLQDLERLREEIEALSRSRQDTRPVQVTIESDEPERAALVTSPAPTPPPEYFGYDFFTRREGIDIWENLPIPKDYRLGAGDEIVISMWGDTQDRSKFTISREGSIYIDRIGLAPLAGKTLQGAQNYLRGLFGQVYATLKGPRPTTFMDVNIGDLKLINVTMVGEVYMPSIHAIHPFSTVTTGLIQVGGVRTSGSLRDIRVIRDGQVVGRVDLYSFLIEGQGGDDIALRDQDLVYVPVRKSTVRVQGAVHRPGIYEALEDEDIATVLRYSGWLTPEAGLTVELRRIVPRATRRSDDDAVVIEHYDLRQIQAAQVRDGDEITVRAILPTTKEVYVFGQIKKPGAYGFREGMRLLDLLDLAGGLTDEFFRKSIYTAEAHLIRRDEQASYPEILPIDLVGLRDKNPTENIQLRNLDQVLIRKNPFFNPPENVTVSGEVVLSGVYAITHDNMTLQEIFDKAGGFTTRAFPEGLRMTRGETRVIVLDYDIQVQAGDRIHVPSNPGTVDVTGEVYVPGLIHFRKGRSLDNYVEGAGGFTPDARRNNISVVYPNGAVRIKRFLRSPRVDEGCIVIVHAKPEREPLDITTLLTQTASLTASLATLFFIVSR